MNIEGIDKIVQMYKFLLYARKNMEAHKIWFDAPDDEYMLIRNIAAGTDFYGKGDGLIFTIRPEVQGDHNRRNPNSASHYKHILRDDNFFISSSESDLCDDIFISYLDEPVIIKMPSTEEEEFQFSLIHDDKTMFIYYLQKALKGIIPNDVWVGGYYERIINYDFSTVLSLINTDKMKYGKY